MTAHSDFTGAILVWGAGGHGKVVADLVRRGGHTLAGFIDASPAKLGTVVEPGGGRVVATEEDLLAGLRSGRLPLDARCVVPAMGNNHTRLRAIEVLGAFAAGPLLHPSVVRDPSAAVGSGSVACAMAVINSAACIGRAVIVNSGAIIEHDVVLDDGVHVSPGAVLTGNVRVGTGSWIGARAVVIPGIRIGTHATVGAGTVVLHDVPDGVTIVGNPGRPIVHS